MSQLDMFPKPCDKCLPEFENLRLQSNNKYEAQRVRYCREFLRYQRENFAQRTEINALEVQLKHALEKLLKAERGLIQAWKTSRHAREGFNAWWDAEYDDSDNRFEKDSAAYWAWAGWQATFAQPQEAPQQQAEPVVPNCVAIIEVFDKDWRIEYLSLPVGKHKLYVQQYTYSTPQQRAEPVAKLFGSLPVYDTTQEASKCSQA